MSNAAKRSYYLQSRKNEEELTAKKGKKWKQEAKLNGEEQIPGTRVES